MSLHTLYAPKKFYAKFKPEVFIRNDKQPHPYIFKFCLAPLVEFWTCM